MMINNPFSIISKAVGSGMADPHQNERRSTFVGADYIICLKWILFSSIFLKR